MRYDLVLTIDPGSSNGGMAKFTKGKTTVHRMPKNEEMHRLDRFLKEIADQYENPIVFIEALNMFSGDAEEHPGKAYRIKIMLANYERIKALLIGAKLPYVEIYPQSWQATLGLNKSGLRDNDKKNYFKEFAIKSFPEIKVTLWNSDALCIMVAAWKKINSAHYWIAKRIKNNPQKGFF